MQIVSAGNPGQLSDIVSAEEYQRLIAENVRLKRELDNIIGQLPNLRQLIEYAADALVLHDGDGGIVDCNQRSAEMFAVPREDIYEQNLSHYLGNLVHIMLERVKQLPTGVCEIFVGSLLRDDHSSIPVEIHITAFESHGKKTLCLVIARHI